jgi:hypothetical protein
MEMGICQFSENSANIISTIKCTTAIGLFFKLVFTEYYKIQNAETGNAETSEIE